MLLLAPDSFKGTHAAGEVAAALAHGIVRAGGEADPCPVADGGEGTLDALVAARGGTLHEEDVHDPLGRPLRAAWAELGDGTAVVELARASGLALLAEEERDPWRASTAGTGELVAAAVRAGAREVLVAAGGSATVDGGAGALEAIAAAGGLGDARLVVLCDVTTPWEACARVFGPQKGAGDAAAVARLAARLDELAATFRRDPRGVPGTGAAGGCAGGLWAALGAELAPGAPFVLDAVGFDARLARADGLVVGEGRLDEQSLMGKVVEEACARARAAGVPVHAVVGSSALSDDDAAALGLASVTVASTLAAIEAAGAELAARS